MKLTFLQAHKRLVKSYWIDPATRKLAKNSWPHMEKMTSHEETPADLKQMKLALELHAGRGHCLIRGPLTRPLVNESRANMVDKNALMDWVCFDMDDVSLDCTPEAFMRELGLEDVSYIVHWTASHGFNPNTLNYHLFMQTDVPIPPGTLLDWMQYLNLNKPLLSKSLALNKEHRTLHYPLDLRMAYNTQIIFIAPPELGKGVKDPMAGRGRFELFPGKRPRMPMLSTIYTPEPQQQLGQAIKNKINSLRTELNLPPHKFATKEVRTGEGRETVLLNPDACIVTGVRDDPDKPWVYLNLGDSRKFSSYYVRAHPEILRSFKSDDLFLMKDIVPQYYAQLRASQIEEQQRIRDTGIVSMKEDRIWFTVNEGRHATYWYGNYDPATDALEIYPAKNKVMMKDYCDDNGVPYADTVPVWNFVFDPPSDRPRVDVDNRTINRFQKTVYMRNVGKRGPKSIPPTIHKVLRHLCKGDEATLAYLVNWLAYIVQKRTTPRTAWMFYGTHGTGKGTLANLVLKPLFGDEQVSYLRGDVLKKDWNTYTQNKLLLIFDEVHFPSMKDGDDVQAKMNNMITEPKVGIRRMNVDHTEEVNHAAVICLSNKKDAIHLPPEDRRWNVAPYQNEKLVISDEERDAIAGELQAFHDMLYYHKLDEQSLRTPLKTAAREQLVHATVSSDDDIMEFLMGPQDGDGGSLSDLMSYANINMNDHPDSTKIGAYKRAMQAILERILRNGEDAGRIKRTEVHSIFNMLHPRPPATAHAMTQKLHSMHVDVWDWTVDGEQQRCIVTKWRDADRAEEFLARLAPKPVKSNVHPLPQKARKS